MARVGEQDIHVLHERGSGAHDVALVLTHGWPGSIVEFLHVIDRFAHPNVSVERPLTVSMSSCRRCPASASPDDPRIRSALDGSPRCGTICCATRLVINATSPRRRLGIDGLRDGRPGPCRGARRRLHRHPPEHLARGPMVSRRTRRNATSSRCLPFCAMAAPMPTRTAPRRRHLATR